MCRVTEVSGKAEVRLKLIKTRVRSKLGTMCRVSEMSGKAEVR